MFAAAVGQPLAANPEGLCGAISLLNTLLLISVRIENEKWRRIKEVRDDTLQDSYDFIVVGAGSAGCVVARRLAEDGCTKVLLLEAGGEEPQATTPMASFSYLSTSDLTWHYRGVPQTGACNNTGCVTLRGKMLGGTSAINGMMYVRGNKHDFDLWSQKGNTGWGSEEALRLFKKSENNRELKYAINTKYHSVRGPQDIQTAIDIGANERAIYEGMSSIFGANYDVNGAEQFGTMITQMFSRDSERRSSNRAFLEPIRHLRNLHVETNALVEKILIDPNTLQAYGVLFRGNEGGKTVLSKKEVIVSAGTYNSPQILMLSGIGPEDHLNELNIPVLKDLPVGKNLIDHVSALGARFDVRPDRVRPSDIFHQIKDLKEYFSTKPHKGPWAGEGVLPVTTLMRSRRQDPSDPRPDFQIFFSGFKEHCGLELIYYNQITCTPILMHPKSKGEVRLQSNNVADAPLIFNNIFENADDLDVIVEALKNCSQYGNTRAFRKAGLTFNETQLAGCEDYIFGSDSYWECVARTYTMTFYHPVGTCKMGPDTDPESVVDPELRVRGIGRLRVIDGSVMPEITTGNTNAPILMVAEHGSEFIRATWAL